MCGGSQPWRNHSVPPVSSPTANRQEHPMPALHHAWRSSASRRVRLCLEEKGLAYESRPVDLAKMEHHTPEYLRINPNGVIPALVHDGRPLYESGTICEYIDEAFEG